jgi:hypothetical protein
MSPAYFHEVSISLAIIHTFPGHDHNPNRAVSSRVKGYPTQTGVSQQRLNVHFLDKSNLLFDDDGANKKVNTIFQIFIM